MAFSPFLLRIGGDRWRRVSPDAARRRTDVAAARGGFWRDLRTPDRLRGPFWRPADPFHDGDPDQGQALRVDLGRDELPDHGVLARRQRALGSLPPGRACGGIRVVAPGSPLAQTPEAKGSKGERFQKKNPGTFAWSSTTVARRIRTGTMALRGRLPGPAGTNPHPHPEAP